MPLPVEPFKGYPAKYLPALEPHDIDGCRCDTFGFWRKHLRNVSEVRRALLAGWWLRGCTAAPGIAASCGCAVCGSAQLR